MTEYQNTPIRIGDQEIYGNKIPVDLATLSEETLMMLGYKKEFHFRKLHVFINKDFTNYSFNSGVNSCHHDGYIAEDHKVHIYISKKDVINNQGLRRFVAFAKYMLKNPIIIHISKLDKELEIPIRRLLEGFPNWKLYVEKRQAITYYLYNINTKTENVTKKFLCISYHNSRNNRIRCTTVDVGYPHEITINNKINEIPDIILSGDFLKNFFSKEDNEETIKNTIKNALEHYKNTMYFPNSIDIN